MTSPKPTTVHHAPTITLAITTSAMPPVGNVAITTSKETSNELNKLYRLPMALQLPATQTLLHQGIHAAVVGAGEEREAKAGKVNNCKELNRKIPNSKVPNNKANPSSKGAGKAGPNNLEITSPGNTAFNAKATNHSNNAV